MSHFTRVKDTKVTNVEAFIKACAEMGMTKVKKNVSIRPWAGGDSTEKVETFCCYPDNEQYGIGVQKQDDGTYGMISDWSLTGYGLPADVKREIPHARQFPGEDREVSIEGHGVARAACDEFRGMAKGLVAKHAIKQTYSAQGFMVQETKQDDGSVRLRLSR